MKSTGGIISGLPRRPWARAVAAMSLLPTLAGCLTTEWAPLPRPVVPRDQMLLMAPVEDPQDPGRWRWEEMVLAGPRLEGDSVLVGPALKGGSTVWTDDGYAAVGRARVDQALVGTQRVDRTRTAVLVGVIVLGISAFALSSAQAKPAPRRDPPCTSGLFCGSWIF